MHNPVNTAISFVLLIGVVAGAFAYAAGNPVEIVKAPWFGFRGSPLTAELAEAAEIDQRQGFLVMAVEDGSPADAAGLRGGNTYREIATEAGILPACLGGDLISEINGEVITNIDQILNTLETSRAGDTVVLTVLRDGESRNLTATLGEDPERPVPPLREVCN